MCRIFAYPEMLVKTEIHDFSSFGNQVRMQESSFALFANHAKLHGFRGAPFADNVKMQCLIKII